MKAIDLAVHIQADEVELEGELAMPAEAEGLVLFAHGSGSSRHSPRNQFVARTLRKAGVGTLLFDLLTADEEEVDLRTAQLRFDIGLLAERLVGATKWAAAQAETKHLKCGYFGSSTGGAAALVAAAELGDTIGAVVSRGGRPDLAMDDLSRVVSPTLLIVGGDDDVVIELNETALAQLCCEKRLEIIPGATHLFEEPGALEEVARLAAEWFREHLRVQKGGPIMSLIFSGSANRSLATSVALYLGQQPAACEIRRFPDGELSLRLDESVRDREVFVVQPTAPPVDANLIELLAFADACRRNRARRVTAIVPYFGYARSDKRHTHQEPVLASLAAHLMEAAGINQVVAIDLHASQIEGFFHIPVDNLTAVPAICEVLRDRVPPDAVVVSPDEGRVKMAAHYARLLGMPVAVIHKERESGTSTKVLRVVGDVRGRSCLIIDDMISTGGTIARSIEALLEADARPEIDVAATHGLFVGDAQNTLSHPALRDIFVTDSIQSHLEDWDRLEVISVAPLIASAIQSGQFASRNHDHPIQRSHRGRATAGSGTR